LSSIHGPKAQAKGPESGFPSKIISSQFNKLDKKKKLSIIDRIVPAGSVRLTGINATHPEMQVKKSNTFHGRSF